MKLFFASVGLGLLALVFLVFSTLFVRALFRGTFLEGATVWVFIWPMPILLWYAPRLAGVATIFSISLITELLLLSLLANLVLRVIQKSRRRRTQIMNPPEPPTF